LRHEGNLSGKSITDDQHSSWSIFVGLAVVVLASVGAWFFSPKGENQTYVFPSGDIVALQENNS
jgi:hypothetical protein